TNPQEGEIWLKWLEREFSDRKVRGSNPTAPSRLPLSRLGRPGNIPALVLPSGGMAARHQKGVTAEPFLTLKKQPPGPTPSGSPFWKSLMKNLFAELGSWIANVSSSVPDDVTSIGGETFAIQLPSSANRPTINQRTRATYIPQHCHKLSQHSRANPGAKRLRSR
ncbi:hypothetical protein CSKR_100923, partial [Clonorchis sinensis]